MGDLSHFVPLKLEFNNRICWSVDMFSFS